MVQGGQSGKLQATGTVLYMYNLPVHSEGVLPKGLSNAFEGLVSCSSTSSVKFKSSPARVASKINWMIRKT